MNTASWLPSVVVLAAGLAVGLLVAYRLRHTRPDKKKGEPTPDLDLEIRDLEARREDLYRRLRSVDEDGLGEAERRALEDAAARTLRDLDAARQELPKQRRQEQVLQTAEPADVAAAQQAAAAPAGRSSVLVGFLSGVVVMLVIGLLIYWAVRDAKPRPDAAAPMQTAANPDDPHQGQGQIPAELIAQIEALQAQLAANPNDLQSKKELALSLLAAGQFMDSFSLASEVLREVPEDPDALFVHGVVRLTMGQTEQALNSIDRVLAQHPDHLQALLYRGLALYQMGNLDQAVGTWEMGLEMAGGRHPDFEEMLAMAQSGAQMSPQVSANPTAAAAAPPAPAAAAPDPDGFNATIELGPGASSPPQATLFIFLRPADGGSPVAAKRLLNPVFPLQLSLSAADSMMGGELPESGVIVARLDSDGSVTTTGELDLEAQVEAARGQTIRLVLGQ